MTVIGNDEMTHIKKIILVLLILIFSAFSCMAQKSNPAEMVKACEGHHFTITIPANPTTGYQWQLARPLNNKMIQFIRSEYIADNTGAVGSGGKEIWTFRALQAGRSAIALKYARTWEKEAAPEVRYYIVSIK